MTQAVNNQHDHAPKPVKDPSGGGDAPFDADAAVNAALKALVGTINDLSDYCITMSSMNVAIQSNGVSEAESQVDLYRHLLSAAGGMMGPNFQKVLQGYAASKYPGTEAGFNAYLTSLGVDKATGNSYYSEFLGKVDSDPTMSQSDKDAFAAAIKGWNNDCGGKMTAFSSLIANKLTPELNQATTYVTNWQSLADQQKPTQLQQAIAQTEAEISGATDAWSSIIVKG